MVFDLTEKVSIKNLNVWLKDITDNTDEECVIFLIGNKMDVKTRDIVIADDAKEFANEKNLNYYEVSAKTGSGVVNIFEKITKKIINNIKNERNKNEGKEKIENSNLYIDSNCNKDRGKVEQSRNQMHCC